MSRPIEVTFTNNGIETKVTGLSVNFEIVSDMEWTPNNAVINIINAPLSLQASISSRYTSVRIKVLKDSIFSNKKNKTLIPLFSGDVIYFKKGRDDGKNLLHIIAADSQKAYNNLFISRSFTGSSASLKRILQAIVQDVKGLSFGGMFGLPEGYQFKRGLALCGTLESVMRFFSVTFNADWYIENNELYCVRRGETIGTADVEPIGAATGMIDIPRATLTGVVVKSTLRPELRVGGLIQVDSVVGEGNGKYKTRRIQHYGNSDGSPWHSTLTLFRPEDEPPVKMRSIV